MKSSILRFFLALLLANLYSSSAYAQDYYFAAVCKECGGFLRICYTTRAGDCIYCDNSELWYDSYFGHKKTNCKGFLGMYNHTDNAIDINNSYSGQTIPVVILGLKNPQASILPSTFVIPVKTEVLDLEKLDLTGEEVWVPTTIDMLCEVVQIADFAFKGTGITQLTIPNTVKCIGKGITEGCLNLNTINVNSGNLYYSSPANSNCIIERATNKLVAGCSSTSIPASITAIGDYAFANQIFSSLILPDNLEMIGNSAFLGSKIPRLFIPKSVKEIGVDSPLFSYYDSDFQGNDIYYSNKIDTIEVEIGNPFYDSRDNCNAVVETSTNTLIGGCKNTIIPESIEHIGTAALSCCSLKDLSLPQSLKNIGASAFSYNFFSMVIVPENTKAIGLKSFLFCPDLKSVAISKNVEVIGDSAFYSCWFLSNLSIADGVKRIGVRSFSYAGTGHEIMGNDTDNKLLSVYIPGSVLEIGAEAFCGCPLEELCIEEGVQKIGKGSFESCALKNVSFPSSIEEIAEYAFMYCSNLEIVHFSEGIKHIGKYAFGGYPYSSSVNKITAITIPRSMESIDDYAFWGCDRLTNITVKSKNPARISKATFSTFSNASLYVPLGSSKTYESTDYWKNFKEIIEIDTRQEQTLELAELPAMTYGDGTYELPVATAEGKVIAWSSSDESIALVSGNTIAIKGAGMATITATQDGDDEYKPFSKEYELTIAKAQLTITADDCSMEQGSALPAFTLSYKGFVYGEDETVLTTMPIVTTTATSESPVGTYPITVSGAESQNYAITYVDGTFIVTEAPIVTDISQLTDAVYIEPMTAIAGTEAQMGIKLKNEVDVAGASFTVVLPKGMTLAKDEDGDLIYELNEERAKSGKFAVYWADGEDGSCGIRIMPTGTNTISGKDGTLLTLKLKLDETLDEGEHSVVLKENSLTVKDDEGQLSTLGLASTGTNVTVIKVMPGDVNRDYRVDLTDAIMIVYASLGISQTGFIAKAADVNGDGRVDLTDAVIVVYKTLGVEPKSGMMAHRADGEPVTTDSFIIDDVAIPAGKSIELPICFSADADSKIVGFQLNLNLPDGVTTVKDEDALPVFIKNETLCNKLTFYPTENDGFAALPQTTSAYVKGSEGTLFSVELKADESLTPGTKLTGTVTNAMFTVKDEDGSMRSVDVADFSFGISIVDKTTVGIDDICRESVNDGYYYNLNGQRVDVPRKGLYIQNGKKVRK